MSASDLSKLEGMVQALQTEPIVKEDDMMEKVEKAKKIRALQPPLFKKWKTLMNDCSTEARQRYEIELQHEEDRRRDSAAMRLPLHVLQRRMVLFLVGWHACYCAARNWSPFIMAGINAGCLAGVHRLRAAPYGWHAFYSAFVLSWMHVATTWSLPPLWMIFASGLLVEMCFDIDRCCQRYAWRQECKRLSSLKRIDDPLL